MLGFSADLQKIKSIAKKKIKILEDNCESIGAKFKKKYLGNHGNVGVFSLDFGKIITTGEGGLILTNEKKYLIIVDNIMTMGTLISPLYQEEMIK